MRQDHHHRCNGQTAAAPSKDESYDLIPAGYTGTVWTCPMHPQMRHTKNDGCPICGMALEPETVTTDAQDEMELRDMIWRFWMSAAFTLPLFIYAMGDMIPGQPLKGLVSDGLARWVQLALAAPVVIWGAAPFFRRGWQSLKTRHLNMYTLIMLGVGVASLYSLVATLAPQIFPAPARSADRAAPR